MRQLTIAADQRIFDEVQDESSLGLVNEYNGDAHAKL